MQTRRKAGFTVFTFVCGVLRKCVLKYGNKKKELTLVPFLARFVSVLVFI